MRFPQFMLKVVRITGWALLVLLAVQFATVAIFVHLLPRNWLPVPPLEVHEFTGFAIGLVALLHVIAAVYLAIRRRIFKHRQLQT